MTELEVPSGDAPSPSDQPVPTTDPRRGLSDAEVRQRTAEGRTNAVDERTSRTFGEIVRANVFTRFNAILSVLGIAVLATGRLADGLFVGVLVINALIGIGQEVRAKRTLTGSRCSTFPPQR